MRISLIQSSPNAIGSIYILHDFLFNKDYLNNLKQLVVEAINKDPNYELNNVKATSTDWKKLLQIKEMTSFHSHILQTLLNIYSLRALNPNSPIQFSLDSSWGMKHKKGDHTLEHNHIPCAWSGAFYFDVPCDTFMYFADFDKEIKLENNMLVLFPGTTKHRVSEHTVEKERISMAFNINWNFNSF